MASSTRAAAGAFLPHPRGEAQFNYFREHTAGNRAGHRRAGRGHRGRDPARRNLVAIKGTPEFEHNKAADTPTHAC
ncbi:MAG: hypothetical protein U1F20_04655 [Lysobacterales bacterium]